MSLPNDANRHANLKFLSARSGEELQLLLMQITVPIEIVSMYSHANRHYLWFHGDVKIVKKKSRGRKHR
jgi:hypothetical protein